ncbi:PAS domain S-box protein [Leptospira semungkisensis]|uniref:histidine kinase n=1 Tax=Leptospira semungkisensis TaxID=2484985 RepID=A0A4R9FM78_9LEPT|nr:PAS domain S-box protein [Leptospira semungkisensis]TGJ99462.1 PAS domain S-box protein [Leptospira semungkisensis]
MIAETENDQEYSDNRELASLSLEVANKTPAMLAYWDKNQICKFANEAYYYWFGKSGQDMIGISMKELLGPIYPLNLPYIEGVLAGERQVFEREIPLPSGEIVHTLVTYIPDFVQGEVNGFFVHSADVSPVKKLELDLKRSESKFKSLLEGTPHAVLVANWLGEILLVNNETARQFHYTKEELIGMKLSSLIPEFHKLVFFQQRNCNLSPEQKANLIENVVKPVGIRSDGSKFPIEATLSDVSEFEEGAVYLLVKDITWKKEKDEELRRSLDVISEQNDRLSNFTHIVSHNLRTHSGNIESVLGFLEEAESQEEKEELIQYLKKSSQGLSETIDHLNTVVSIRTNPNIQKVRIDLNSAVAKTIQILRREIESSEAEISVSIPQGLEISHVPAYMDSILLNLISNAIKYRDDIRKPNIKIRAYEVGSEIILRVKDNGKGIDLKKHGSKLFGMYKTFHGNKDAHGVGLFITRNQIESLGGKIEVESKEGVGTRFTVRFLAD